MIDTIIAQCTPSGTGALALIRLSGPKALFIASKAAYLSSKKILSEVATHTIHHGWIVDINHVKIDEVLFFVMHGPKTFTGEHTVEISCHNNPFIIQGIIDTALDFDRMAGCLGSCFGLGLIGNVLRLLALFVRLFHGEFAG